MFEYEERKKEEVMKSNHTNIPSQLKEKVEQSTGLDLGDVHVHYNSDKPIGLDALAYTQGNQIYLGSGQERHLPHELGHVVQQKMGIVHADTRHRSGVWMNTNEALEQQADRIGAGESVVGYSKIEHLSKPPVQRMTVYEGMRSVRVSADEARNMGLEVEGNGEVEVKVPKIARYKRKGWKFIQSLNQYFNKSSTENATMTQMEGVYRNLEKLVQVHENMPTDPLTEELGRIKGEFEYTERFQKQLEEREKGFQHLKKETEELTEILRFGMELTHNNDRESTEQSEKWENDPIKSLEKRGEYVRISDADPYFNYKKIAMHCIAHMATGVAKTESGKNNVFLGPHVAITVVGKTIYIANNTNYKLRKKETPADMETLKLAVRRAIDGITKNEIESIMKEEGGLFVKGAGFEGLNPPMQLKEEQKDEVLQWIEKIRNYPIAVVDVPEARSTGEVIHGEMTIMDYLESRTRFTGKEDLPGSPITTHQILQKRNSKLREIQDDGQEKNRVIQFGGTRIDCRVCHEHFNQLRTVIRENYIISSNHTSTIFEGTQHGTHPASINMGGKAEAVGFELDKAFAVVIKELGDLKNSLIEILESRKNAETAQEFNEIDMPKAMAQLIDEWNEALPALKEMSSNDTSQVLELEKLIYEVTSLFLFGKIIE